MLSYVQNEQGGILMNLGETIYRLRTERNLSQGDLADALDVSRQSVSKWENNSAVPELEKLIKMAQIFGITIDELVTGEAKPTPAAPPPQPVPPAPKTKGLSTQQILGIVLLSLGGLALIIFTVVGIFTGAWVLGLITTAPFLLCGTSCLLCRRNAALWCAWAIFLPLWFVCFVFMGRGFDADLEGLIRCATLVYGLVLFTVSLIKVYKEQLPIWCKALITIGVVVLLYIHVMGFMPVRSATVTTDQIHQVIIPDIN
jgi:transcriptional regulator with XRE-family HTH domain